MDGPGDFHAKWSKSDKDKYMILLLCELFKKMVQIYLQNRLTDLEKELMATRGERWGMRNSLGVWDWHVHTAIFKMHNQQGPNI